MKNLIALAVFLTFAGCSAARGAPAKGLPAACKLKAGQSVLLLGDSIVATGMLSYTANALLDRSCPGHGVTFHSIGRAGETAQGYIARVPDALKGRRYDWIILNFAHNDVGKYQPDEFKKHAASLLDEVRKVSDAKLAWMSILGNDPRPSPKEAKRAAATRQKRQRQKLYAQAAKELCEERGILYLPTGEVFEQLLRERAEREYPVTLTYDGVHPNVLGNWLVGAAILQGLGLRPRDQAVDMLAGAALCDHGRRAAPPLKEPLRLEFKSVFVQPRLVPVSHEFACSVEEGITLDGDLADWAKVAEVGIAPPLHVTMELEARSSQRYAASMRTCRDGRNLYFAFEVTEPDTSEGAWFPEIIEIMADARKDTSRSGNVWRGTAGLTQFALHRDFTGNAGEGCVKVMVNGDKSQGEGVRAVARKTDAGYAMEVAIPLAGFKQVRLGPGAKLPFDWAMSFTDQASNLDLMGLMGRCSTTRAYATLVMR